MKRLKGGLTGAPDELSRKKALSKKRASLPKLNSRCCPSPPVSPQNTSLSIHDSQTLAQGPSGLDSMHLAVLLLAVVAGILVTQAAAQQQSLQVGYPSQPLVTCGLTQLLWSSSVGKTNVSIIAAGESLSPSPRAFKMLNPCAVAGAVVQMTTAASSTPSRLSPTRPSR